MLTYQQYTIKDNEQFESGNYPQMVNDLNNIKKGTANIPAAFKADILISFAKNHSLKMEWINANPEFAELVTSGALPIKNIESLFEASYQNSFFRHQFETFLKNTVN